jgi:hypothetical protein
MYPEYFHIQSPLKSFELGITITQSHMSANAAVNLQLLIIHQHRLRIRWHRQRSIYSGPIL